MRLSQRSVRLSAESLGSVLMEKYVPFLHQRYDITPPGDPK